MLKTKSVLDESPAILGRTARRAKAALAARIGTTWGSGEQIPSMRVLASELDVAVGTVRAVIRQMVAEGQLVAVSRLGVYVPPLASDGTGGSVSAPASSIRKTIAVELICEQDADPFVHRMVEAFSSRMREHGGRTFIDSSQPWRHRQQGHRLDLRLSQSAAVAIFNPLIGDIISREDLPTVVISSSPRAVTCQGCDLLSIDEEQAVGLAAELVRNCGEGHVGFIGVTGDKVNLPTLDVVSSQRLEVFARRLGRVPSLIPTTSYGERSGARAARIWSQMSPRPKTIFAASDELAVGFVHGTEALGFHAGSDYQIIGFDGQDRARLMDGGPLTSIEVPCERLGSEAADLLLRRIHAPGQPGRRLLLGCSVLPGTTLKTSITHSRGGLP